MSVIRPVVRIMPVAKVRQKRLLPVPGRVVVNQGKTVKATETVAEAYLEPRFHLVNVARSLGVPRAEADDYIVCHVGEVIRKGDVLGKKGGMFRKVVNSPVDGEVVLAGDGQVLIREYVSPWELPAGFPGKVSKVFAGQGVELTTTGSVIDGVWGNGKLAYGLLYNAGKTPDAVLDAAALGVELRGMVVVAGKLEDAHALEVAESLPVRGIIVGSMPASLIPEALKVSFPILVLDGFGAQEMNSHAFRLLATSDGRQAAVLAEPMDRYRGVRPAVIIPLPNAEMPPEPPEAVELSEGVTVRLTRAPYVGMLARVIDVPPGLVRFPNGLRAPGVEVRLENGDRALVPVANVEVLVQS
ncbi:MAG: hypothetical protein GXO56_06040 [Chloroflexi bacterium]|nr:hypothetical protein [Chloroflexota bacterium]